MILLIITVFLTAQMCQLTPIELPPVSYDIYIGDEIVLNEGNGLTRTLIYTDFIPAQQLLTFQDRGYGSIEATYEPTNGNQGEIVSGGYVFPFIAYPAYDFLQVDALRDGNYMNVTEGSYFIIRNQNNPFSRRLYLTSIDTANSLVAFQDVGQGMIEVTYEDFGNTFTGQVIVEGQVYEFEGNSADGALRAI